MNGIKVTKHNDELITYTDAANRHEVSICHMDGYYCGWYYVNEEENSYQGKMAEDDSLEKVIAALALLAATDFGLRYGRAEEMFDLLDKVKEMYPRD